LLDDVCRQLCSRTAGGDWISLPKLSEIVRSFYADEKDAEAVLDFLGKYFLEVDESESKARLSPWLCSLLEIPSS